MKKFKLFLAMLTAVLFSGFVSSCSDDENFKETLAGVWKTEGSSVATYDLKSDGTGTLTWTEEVYDNDKGDYVKVTKTRDLLWTASDEIITITIKKDPTDEDSYDTYESYKYYIVDDYATLTSFDDSQEMILYRGTK